MKFATFERRIARPRAQFVLTDAERFVGIDENEIGWRPLCKRTCVEPENMSRSGRQCPKRQTETGTAVMMQTQNDWQQRFETDRTERGLRERLTLGVGRL